MRNLKKILSICLATATIISSMPAKATYAASITDGIPVKAESAIVLTDVNSSKCVYNSGDDKGKARPFQNFYIGSTYVYTTQSNGSTTYLSRFTLDEKGTSAKYKDQMVLKEFGHGESLEVKDGYVFIGTKAVADEEGKVWSTQVARIKYQAGKTINTYTDAVRFAHLNYANKTGESMGELKRVNFAISGDKFIFRVQSAYDSTTKKGGDIQYSTYDYAYLNSLLDAKENKSSKYVSFKQPKQNSDAVPTNKCLSSFIQSKANAIRPNGSFQGLELSSAGNIYTCGGNHGQYGLITMMDSTGKVVNTVKLTNKAVELEGLQLKTINNVGYVYTSYNDITERRKDKQTIYRVKSSLFHTQTK